LLTIEKGQYILFLKILKIALIIHFSLFSTACVLQRSNPQSQNWQNQSNANIPDVYIVQHGDTLSSISRRYGKDFREIAYLNGINPPYRIYIGQRLRIHVSNTTPVVTTPTPTTQGRKRRLHPNFSKQNFTGLSTLSLNSSGNCYPPVQWQWPTRGNVAKTTSSTGAKGINIFARLGQAIRAAATGTVLYSGVGVNGYKNLIIIQHNNAFMSTYSNNHRRYVREGQPVVAGEIIADMGQNSLHYPMLHFEIRCREKALDPLFYLPR